MKTIPHSFLLALASVTLCGMPALRAADTDPKIAEVTKTAEAASARRVPCASPSVKLLTSSTLV